MRFLVVVGRFGNYCRWMVVDWLVGNRRAGDQSAHLLVGDDWGLGIRQSDSLVSSDSTYWPRWRLGAVDGLLRGLVVAMADSAGWFAQTVFERALLNRMTRGSVVLAKKGHKIKRKEKAQCLDLTTRF